MTEREINDGNRIIAESHLAPDHVKLNIAHYKESGNDYMLNEYLSEFKFNRDWNSLMGVVININSIKYHHVHITKHQCIITSEFRDSKGFITEPTGTINVCYREIDNVPLILIVFEAVAKFINWHNQTTTDKGRGLKEKL